MVTIIELPKMLYHALAQVWNVIFKHGKTVKPKHKK